MRRGRMVLLCTSVVMLMGLVSNPLAHGFEAAHSPPQPVPPTLLINQDFADPDILKTDSGYLAFSTMSAVGKVPVASAEKPEGPWRVQGDALAAKPPWGKDGEGFWAPDVSRLIDGTYLMYFSTREKSSGQMCIGTATSSAPTGPYFSSAQKPLICASPEAGIIDPQTFTDADGSRFLLYKIDAVPMKTFATIWLQKVGADGISLIDSPRELLRSDVNAEHTVVEAPVMMKQPSRYVLFYSADIFTSTGYHTSYATAPSITGPFIKSDQPLLSTEKLSGKVDGPGGADIIDDRVFFHGWLTPEHKNRGMYSLPLTFPGELPQVQ